MNQVPKNMFIRINYEHDFCPVRPLLSFQVKNLKNVFLYCEILMFFSFSFSCKYKLFGLLF